MEPHKEFHLTVPIILIGLVVIGIFLVAVQFGGKDSTLITTDTEQNGGSTAIDFNAVANHLTAAVGTILFEAPNIVAQGATALFAWDVNNPELTACSGTTEPPGSDGGWSGEKPLRGTQMVGPIVKDTTYFLDCTGTDDAERNIELVTVLPVVVSIDAYPKKVPMGSVTTIAWSSANSDSCHVTDDNGAVVSTDTAGTLVTPSLRENATYMISCEAPKGFVDASVIVSVTK